MKKEVKLNQATPETVEPKAKSRSKAIHPPTSEMVLSAIKTLKDRKGSSMYAIKKYIAANYLVDIDKMSMYIKKFIRSAVEDKVLVQTKGVGASGSFKLGAKAGDDKSKTKKSPPAVRQKVEKEQKSKTVKKSSKMAPPKTDKVNGNVQKKKVTLKVTTKQVTAVAKKETKKATMADSQNKSVNNVPKKIVEKKNKSPAKTKTPKPKKVSQKMK